MDPRRLKSIDEDTVLRQKHDILLQEYLVLQKECVSRKRKLKESKERKETLIHEIRFLKRRRDLLIDSQELEGQHEAVQSKKWDAKFSKYNGETSGRYYDAKESAFQNPKSRVGGIWKSGKEEVGFAALKLGKRPKDLFSNGKRAEKRKICWQDPVVLKV